MRAVAQHVVVRYWAAARAAAGVEQDLVAADQELSLRDVLDAAASHHHGNRRFADVLAVCSVLVGEEPAGRPPWDEVMVRPGQVVELLPPFAGGARCPVGHGEPAERIEETLAAEVGR